MKPLQATTSPHKPDGTLPLINIVLLLVLAFMIAGTIAAPLPEDFQALQAGSGEAHNDSNTAVDLTMNLDGHIQQAGQSMEAEAVTTLLASTASNKGQLTLRSDARAPAQAVLAFLAQAKEAGIENAMVITMDRVE